MTLDDGNNEFLLFLHDFVSNAIPSFCDDSAL